jgi:hypothetical protein
VQVDHDVEPVPAGPLDLLAHEGQVGRVEVAALGFDPGPRNDEAHHVEAVGGDGGVVGVAQRSRRGQVGPLLVVLAERVHVDAAEQHGAPEVVDDPG